MSLPAWFSDQKIYKKLIFTNAIVISMALIPLMIVICSYEYYAVRKAVLQEIRVQADIVSDSVAGALAFADAETALEALTTLKAAPSVKMAVLLLPDKAVLNSYSRSGEVIPDKSYLSLEAGGERLTFNRFALKKAVFLKENYVGALVVEASLEEFYERIALFFVVIFITTVLALFLSLWLAAILRDSITRPISVLLSSVQRVTQKQDFTVRPQAAFPDEIGDLSHAFGEMMNNIQERDKRLQELAFYDKITQLPNRNFFQESIKQAVRKVLKTKTSAALLYIDLDDFKKINDTLGHDIGDQLLEHVGQQLRVCLRDTDRVFRIGGDEFSIILEGIEDAEIAITIAEKIICKICEPVVVDGNKLKVTASIGISYCPEQAKSAADFLKFSDIAMYAAKNSSKNSCHVYSADRNLVK